MVESYKTPPTKKSRREKNSEKVPSSTSSTEVMADHIWKEFPEDLYEAVIARLPVAAIFRFRSVCQKWNSLLTSHSFSKQYEEVQQLCPWFYIVTQKNDNNGAMYDPSLKKWHHPKIFSLPRKEIFFPMASAGGIICFLECSHWNLYVCNPLTQSFRELPARSIRVWTRVAVGMTLNGKTANHGYKILWLTCNGDYDVYDSIKNSWSQLGNMPASIKLPLFLDFRSPAVAIGNTLYFMRANPDGFVSYDMTSGVWQQFAIPLPPHLMDPSLAECQGKIMLIGLLTKNAATCVCVWELQKMTLLWKEVDRMPNMMCLEFYGKHVRMHCLGNRGLLLLSLKSRRMNRLVSYDVASGMWKKVPVCMPPRGRKQQWIACGTAFHPCLTALA